MRVLYDIAVHNPTLLPLKVKPEGEWVESPFEPGCFWIRRVPVERGAIARMVKGLGRATGADRVSAFRSSARGPVTASAFRLKGDAK